MSFGNYTMCNIEKLARQFLLGHRNSNNMYKVKFATCAPVMHIMCPSFPVPLLKILNLSFPESPHLRESGFREIFACGIQNPENLSCGIWNPRFWDPEYSSRDPTNAGVHYLEFGICGVESRIQDCLGFTYVGRLDDSYTREKL